MPDYEVTVAGRIGLVIASCLPDFRCVAPPATVFRVLVTSRGAVDDIVRMLFDHHLAVIDIRINRIPARSDANVGAS